MIAEFQAVLLLSWICRKRKEVRPTLVEDFLLPSERDLMLVNMDSSVYWQEGEGGLDPKCMCNNYLDILFEPLISNKKIHKMPSQLKYVEL